MLVVDDAEINRTLLRQIFSDSFEVIEASNGQEALEKLRTRDVSIVLLDLVMPVMDGFEVLAYLRCHDTFVELPVIAMTTIGDHAQTPPQTNSPTDSALRMRENCQ